MAKVPKYVYFFGNGKAEGTAEMKNLLGGKGANLAEMVNIGLPVPPGFSITTEVCTAYYQNKQKYPKPLQKEVLAALAKVEKAMGAKLGDAKNPLLVSIRSGARASMPGMMDTILNLGLNDKTVAGLIAKTKNERFVYDSYRRFVQMYGDVVLGLKPVNKDDIDPFEEIIEAKKHQKNVKLDTELTADDLKELVVKFKAAIKEKTGHDFPEDPLVQMWGAIGAVFSSWMNDRAIAYRKMYDIPESWGTAVNVQSMVFGNMGEDSGTGVAFTRDAATGENYFYGEYLMNAQGEDVVAGTRTPLPISKLKEQDAKLYGQLDKIRKTLEKHYHDMMDVEFTIQQGKLYMLQCRVGKRTAFAAIKIAVDMVVEKLISEKEALTRIEPDQLNQLLRPIFDLKEKETAVKSGRLLAKGLNAGPGAATGRIVFNAVDAEAWKNRGEKVILTRIETSPEDIKGMDASEGILTARGGMTSHAALVARQMGKVCVAGCDQLNIDYSKHTMTVKDKVLKEGDWISLDGSTGQVIEGKIQTKPSEVLQVLVEKTLDPKDAPVYQTFEKVMAWADKYRTLNIRTNADQPDQAANAIAFGAEGIGLCRTEHMFFSGERIVSFRKLICVAPDVKALRDKLLATNDEAERAKIKRELTSPMKQYMDALKELLPLQRKDFEGMFTALKGRPCTIRFLDPPLHEFLPHDAVGQQELAKALGIDVTKIKSVVALLHEFNPMLGHRGCRLGMTYPEITKMQTQAVLEAAFNVQKKKIKVIPEIMIPLVGIVSELVAQKKVIAEAVDEFLAAKKLKVLPFTLKIGTMIEVPRAAVTADEIAVEAEFFSFGTNDLTQMGSGFSRDDAGRFLTDYVRDGIYEHDPFQSLDQKGIGKLIKYAVAGGRSVRPDIKLGICGEHGGEPKSIAFCHEVGLTYVSCSPYRVPVARLAAAHAAIHAHAHANAHHKK